MIVARNLSRRFGKVLAVDSINFRIAPGRVVGFLGPNGAGKTTTIRMIAGFLTPSSGTVLVNATDVRTDPLAVRRSIGYLPESTPLYGEMRVVEFLRFRARLFGLPARRRETAVDQAVRCCWLDDVQRRPIRHLSRGFRQRVGLAAALLHDPKVLILDEPTVGLDPAQIREVRSLIRELAGRHTILLSTHILSEAELSCDEVIMIARGRIRAQGTIDDLRASAARATWYTVETDAEGADEIVAELPGVAEVEITSTGDGWRRLRIRPAEDAPDQREPIGAALAGRGATVRELGRSEPTLEQMFLQRVGAAERSPTGHAVGAEEDTP